MSRVLPLLVVVFSIASCSSQRYVVEGGKVVDRETGEAVSTDVPSPTPDGLPEPDSKLLDFEPYPGSKTEAGKFNFFRTEADDGIHYDARWTSKDDPAKISRYFQAQLNDDKESKTSSGFTVTGKTQIGHDALIIISRPDPKNPTTISANVIAPKVDPKPATKSP